MFYLCQGLFHPFLLAYFLPGLPRLGQGQKYKIILVPPLWTRRGFCRVEVNESFQFLNQNEDVGQRRCNQNHSKFVSIHTEIGWSLAKHYRKFAPFVTNCQNFIIKVKSEHEAILPLGVPMPYLCCCNAYFHRNTLNGSLVRFYISAHTTEMNNQTTTTTIIKYASPSLGLWGVRCT